MAGGTAQRIEIDTLFLESRVLPDISTVATATGLVLVFLMLGIFLEMRLAFWVMLGIPISFLGTFLFMSGMDVSLNMVTMFAFLIALGIVVDDAIVVGRSSGLINLWE